MEEIHPHIKTLLECIRLEEQEQVKRYSLDKEHSLKILRSEGLALYPIQVVKKTFGYADYPEITFRLPYPQENQFRDGCAIECFMEGEEPIKGVLLYMDGKQGEFRLFAPDYPDWIEHHQVGIKLTPDTRTTTLMKEGLKQLPKHKALYELFNTLHGKDSSFDETTTLIKEDNLPDQLNASQQQAVRAIWSNLPITLVHGPPGTGKTTSLIEAIAGLAHQGKKILVTAPSNTAVDNIALGLLRKGLSILRVGNTTKVHEFIFPHTPEGRLAEGNQRKEIKELKIRAEQFRKMALKYKRSFGKAEREQRNLLFKEVKNIRAEIKKLLAYNEEKLFQTAQVILGTPIGILDAPLKDITFQTLVMDEAGQCLEPLAWCIFPLGDQIILAGDPFQLPPTVLSEKAAKLGFNTSILEVCFHKNLPTYLLDTQYRMRPVIAGFSSAYFYQGLLQTAAHLLNDEAHFIFYDTAGSGYQEEFGKQGSSLQNTGELDAIVQIIQQEQLDPAQVAFISPYAGQVELAKEKLPDGIRKSTIDSFQGQEKEVVIISMVRSNDEGQIGFLNDYRRMNVALTRAKDKLIVVGDSATLGRDPFYLSFLEYAEQQGSYRTVWELA